MFYYFYVLKNKYGNDKPQKDAQKRERQIKDSGQARRWLKERIENSLKG